MHNDDVLTALPCDDELPLDSLVAMLGVERTWLLERAEEGFFPGLETRGERCSYSLTVVRRVRRMHRVERDFDAVPELAALVADLFEELDRLRAQNRNR